MKRILNVIKVTAVSSYLLAALSYLLLARKLPSEAFKKALRSVFRPKYSGKIDSFMHDEGFCWIGALPESLCSDMESASRIMLYENDRPLGPAHVCHDEIRELGCGRFSHWGARIYFSTSDNSDLIKNGRIYSVREI